MTDCRRLARHLRDALLAAPLAVALGAGGCSQPAPPPSAPVSPTGAAPSSASWSDDPSTPAQVAPATGPEGPEQFVRPEPPFPAVSDMCDSASWCGNAEAGRSRAPDSAGNDLCVPRFNDGNRYFHLDSSKTEERRLLGEVDTCCYEVRSQCVVPGRPLVIDGALIMAPVARGASAGEVPSIDRRIGEAWLADARAEHASIASFARAALELMAVGAPLALVGECQRAGLDEVRHAELCFGLAERYLGRALSVGALPAPPARAPSLARLAADTFEEGCVGETTATLMAERALAGCVDPQATRALTRILRDERRHAALAWKTVAWAIEAGGREVIDALAARVVACTPEPSRALPVDAALAAHGRLDPHAVARARHDAWHQIIVPTLGWARSARRDVPSMRAGSWP
ncbi:MAG TPA: ferritin-like domain-containing protein [Kofleriaceae bacterium]|nr:ferritin-like domain-containing protein [Kofleriaceae bacterium]